MNNNARGIVEVLQQAVYEDFDDKTIANWKKLQQSARVFLKNQTFLKRVKKQARTEIVSSEVVSKYSKFSSDIIKTAENSKKFYEALFEFDEVLTKYLGEVPKRALYVFYNEQGKPLTYEMSMQQLANISQGKGRIGELKLSDLKAIENQIDKNAKGDLEHINRGASAVMGVNKRLERFYSQRGKQTIINKENPQQEKTKEAQRQNGLLMWKTGGTWKIAKVANQGVVNEAYTAFLLTKHKTKKDYLVNVEIGNSPYFSHSLIAKFYKYFSSVTNMPAIVEEDIYTEWAQYAVKGKKAGLPSPKQYIRTAYTILSSSNEIAPNELKKMIKEAFFQDNKLAPFVGEFLDETIEENIKDILQKAGFKEANIKEIIPY